MVIVAKSGRDNRRPRMILHCVFLRFKSSVQDAEKQEIYAAIAALKDTLSGIIDVKFGPNISSEGLSGGFADGFVVTFESPEARDTYLAATDHLTVAERIIASADGGLSGLIVYDLAV
jgi:hypothetical protein